MRLRYRAAPALVLALAVMGGCARQHHPEPASEELAQVRRPDGVFLDILAAEPTPGATTPRGIVALSLPLSTHDANHLLHSYFRAFMGGDGTALGVLVAHGAKRLDDGASNPDLLRSLEHRLRNVDYSHLPVDQVAAYEDVRVSPFETVPTHVQSQALMLPGDVLLDVPMRIQQVGLVRMFGPRVEIVVRRASGRGAWQIVALRELDAPWP